MGLPRFRLRTLMIAVAVVALDLVGLVYGTPKICAGCLILTVASTFIFLLVSVARALVSVARKIGINAFFR